MQTTSETTTEPDCRPTQAATTLPNPASISALAPIPAPSVPRPSATRQSATLPSDGMNDAPIVLSGVLGTVERLADSERAELMACEVVIEAKWESFVEAGVAFAQIRDKHLYKEEYDTFEDYCRAKWQYGRTYVYRLISAAQVFKHLLTFSQQIRPTHETQIRPLVGLIPAQAEGAWKAAVESARGRQVTAQLVKKAVRALKMPPKDEPPKSSKAKLKAERCRLIASGLDEFFALITQKSPHDVLLQKFESLHAQIRGILGNAKAHA